MPILYQGVMPAGLGWDTVHFPFTASIYDAPGLQRSVGVCSQTPEGFFNSVSTALTAPGATYYVATNGSDSANGLTSSTPFASLYKAINTANAAGVPTKCYVAAGIYPRSTGTNGAVPIVDIAWVATGGRVVMGTFDQYSAPSRDATYTNCYSYTTSNTARVVDLINLDVEGNYNDFQNVATPAQCNATPNSWVLSSGTLYINRGDWQAVTYATTRVYRGASYTFNYNSQVNVYIGDGLSVENGFPPSGFDIEGSTASGAYGGLSYIISSPNNSVLNVIAAKNCTFKYTGSVGPLGLNGLGVAMNSHSGLACFFNCRADKSATDGFNHHNPGAATTSLFLTVNCTGFNNGLYPNASNNGWTSHETCVGADIGGYYRRNHGGTLRSINTARAWFLGTCVENDLGDTEFGGTLPPDAVSVANSAQYWCDRVKVNIPAGNSYGFVAEGVTSVIYIRGGWPIGTLVGGAGAILAY